MWGRGKGKHQNALLLAGTLTPNLSVELGHLDWSQWQAVLFSRDESLNQIICLPCVLQILDLNVDGKERKI